MGKTFLEKAALVVADLTAGGKLEPQQATKFIRIAIKEAKLLPLITVTPMRANEEKRDKMRFANQVLRPGTETTPLPSADWAKPTLSYFNLVSKLFRAEVRVSEEVFEDQIEYDDFKQTLMEEFAKAIGRDMEKVAIQGDTTSTDPLLAHMDGFLKKVTTYTVDALGNKLVKTYLRDMDKALPDEFANNSNYMYFSNRQAVIDYEDSLADRATPLGDHKILSADTPMYKRRPVVEVPLFPVDVSDQTQALYMDPKNAHLGVHRDIKIKVAEDISAGGYIMVANMRFDVEFAEETAVVKAIKLVGV